jgi:hypothetical protein
VLLQLLLPALLISMALSLPWLLAVWWMGTDKLLLLHLLLPPLPSAAVRLGCHPAVITQTLESLPPA